MLKHGAIRARRELDGALSTLASGTAVPSSRASDRAPGDGRGGDALLEPHTYLTDVIALFAKAVAWEQRYKRPSVQLPVQVIRSSVCLISVATLWPSVNAPCEPAVSDVQSPAK